MNDLIENIILKHFHGFTKEQWQEIIRNKEFPYIEIPEMMKSLLTPVPGPPPKDGKRYPCKPDLGDVLVGCFWSKKGEYWSWDIPLSHHSEPVAHLSFSLDDL